MYSMTESIIPIASLSKRVKVEAQILGGLPSTKFIGLSESSAREIRERVYLAIKSSGYRFPRKKIRISITPDGYGTDNSCLDLPVALAILLAAGTIPLHPTKSLFAAGLCGVDGKVQYCNGIAHNLEAAQNEGKTICEVSTLKEAVQRYIASGAGACVILPYTPNLQPDIEVAKSELKFNRLLERIALLTLGGRHNLLLRGPYGVGKSKLLELIGALQPDPTEADTLELMKQLYREYPIGYPSICVDQLTTPRELRGHSGQLGTGLIHHAHLGVMVADEINCLSSRAIAILQGCMDNRYHETLFKGNYYKIPTDFQLLGSMNLCRCGLKGSDTERCNCQPIDIDRYLARATPRFLSRFDIIYTSNESLTALSDQNISSSIAEIREKVSQVRSVQIKRAGKLNSQLTMQEIEDLSCTSGAKYKISLLSNKLATRDLMMICRVARTLADIEDSADVEESHILEARGYRAI